MVVHSNAITEDLVCIMRCLCLFVECLEFNFG